jgi:hypothetical protein
LSLTKIQLKLTRTNESFDKLSASVFDIFSFFFVVTLFLVVELDDVVWLHTMVNFLMLNNVEISATSIKA